MSELTIWHNPRCSKSREALSLLREAGHEPRIREYLKDPPSVTEILHVLVKLGIDAQQLVRSQETVYSDLGLSKNDDDKRLVLAMSENPILIERPVIIRGEQARIGRPPENALEVV